MQEFHHYFGNEFKVECPTGSGTFTTLQAGRDRSPRRLTRVFLKDAAGRRPVAGALDALPERSALGGTTSCSTMYFHGDNGAGSRRKPPDRLDLGMVAKLLAAERTQAHDAAKARTLPWERWPRRSTQARRSMPRFKLLIEHAARYSGWQIQKNARTVQGEIDRAGSDGDAADGSSSLRVRPAGRRRCTRFTHRWRTGTSTRRRSLMLLRRKINDELPADIHIRSIDQASRRFRAALHDATVAELPYQTHVGERPSKPFVWWI